MSNDPGRQVLAEGAFLRLVRAGGWEYVERTRLSGIVVILAVTDDRRLILTEQFRKPVGKRVIELPAGLAGDVEGAEGEALATAAHRELQEEAGYEAAEMVFLTEGPPSAGLSTEMITFFRARGLKPCGAGGGDGTEDILVHGVRLDEVAAWLELRRKEGLLIDPKVYAGLYFVEREE